MINSSLLKFGQLHYLQNWRKDHTMSQTPFQTYRSSILNESQPFYDAVSSISAANMDGQDLVGITSWDGSVRISKLSESNQIPRLEQLCFGRYQPCNQCCFNKKGDNFYFSDIFGTVYVFDLNKMKAYQVVSHSNNAFCSLSIDDQEKHLFFTTYGNSSYRYKINGKQKCTFKNIFCAKSKFRKSIRFDNFVFGLNSVNKINVYAINGLKSINSQIQWKLQDMKTPEIASTFALSNNLKKIAVGKTEGLVAIADISKIDNSQFELKNQFSLHSNKHEENDSLYFYPVNCMSFHPSNQNILVVGLSDGDLTIFDVLQKKTLGIFSHQGIPVTSLAYTLSGKHLIYALGDDFHQGQKFNSKWQTSLKILAI